MQKSEKMNNNGVPKSAKPSYAATSNRMRSDGVKAKNRNYCSSPDFEDCSGDIRNPTGNYRNPNVKANMSASVNAYKKSKSLFACAYSEWLFARRSSLKELKALLAKLHEEQLNCNKAHTICREIGYQSRSIKSYQETEKLDFAASLVAFFSDAASGITSIVQACSIDSYQKKFQEIMDEDAEVTKPLYEARSKCVDKYHGIEEVIRKYHSSTFDSTVNEISNILKADKFWVAMHGSGDMSKFMSIAGNFVDVACQSENLSKISDSITTYIDDNPATLAACKSVGRAVYGAYDTWGIDKSKPNAMRTVGSSINQRMMIEDRKEIDRLTYAIKQDLSQTKLETKMQGAIDALESEMSEITNAYVKLFNNNYDN